MGIKSFPVIDLVATGKNIVRLRKESGLSVADLQEYFGFEAPQAIYKWQKGRSLPSTDNLLALGHLLDVSMEEILVTRPTIIDIMPQEESCGSHRFGSTFLFNQQFNDFCVPRRYDSATESQRRGRGVKKVISRDKMSKKARRELDRQKRNTWPVSPIMRVKESGKLYSRKKKWIGQE